MDEPAVLGTTMKPTDNIKTDINILLLGESGVGKSTFINSFANYLQYETLEEALRSDLFCLIPTVFTISDENFEDRTVEYGYDTSKDKEIGQPSIQTYVFPLKEKTGKIRLIDTPGIGDSGGNEQDERNFENVLTYLSLFKEIHAICFLLKPNVTVISPYFKFCIKQLISRLEDSVSENIVFIFTNSRSTFYKPGSTSRLLKIILDEVEATPPNVKIPFSKNNMFCIDNEVFKYLVAVRKGIPFGDAEKCAYLESWKQSVESTWNLLHYIAGNEENPGLTPYQMQNTLSVNDARRTVLDLTRPIADISDLIQDNLAVLNMHKKHILDDDLSMSDLENTLYVPIINLQQTSLPDPVVVCTSNTCSEVCVVSGLKKYNYKKRCCKPCKEINIERELIGSPSLLNCQIFDVSKQCKECKCDFSCHMQIFYETSLRKDTIEDESIKKEIKSKEDMIEARYKAIVVLKGRISEFEQERDTITKAIAKFAHFLKKSSISSHNDAFQNYIDYLIERENSLGSGKSYGVISRYKFLKKQHEEEMKIFDSVDNGETVASITPEEIQSFIESLYRLKHTGKKIKELHTKQQKVGQSLHLKSMVHCHPKSIEKPASKAKDKSDLSSKFEKLNLSSINLEQLAKHVNLEEMVADYMKSNENAGPSSGTKPKQSKKKNNQDLSKNEKKKNIDQIKNNIAKAEAEGKECDVASEKGPKKNNKSNEPKKKKLPNQNYSRPQNYHQQGPNIPFNHPNQYQHNQYPRNEFPQNPYLPQHPPQMGMNQFPIGPYQPMGFRPNLPPPQQYHPQNPNLQYGPPQFPPPQNPPSYHGSNSNLSQTSNENKPSRPRPNQRGKPRGNYKNVNQRPQRNESEQGPSVHRKEGNFNKFKKPSGKKNINQKKNDGSDSDDSQASYKRPNKQVQKETPEESLNYEMMKRFLEEQKKVMKEVKKKPSDQKKSETVIMMIRRND